MNVTTWSALTVLHLAAPDADWSPESRTSHSCGHHTACVPLAASELKGAVSVVLPQAGGGRTSELRCNWVRLWAVSRQLVFGHVAFSRTLDVTMPPAFYAWLWPLPRGNTGLRHLQNPSCRQGGLYKNLCSSGLMGLFSGSKQKENSAICLSIWY